MPEPPDAEALLALALAYLRGTPEVPRDLAKCFACYRAAADLGSLEADYPLALFYLSGKAVPQDVGEGMRRLREAAHAGSVVARVHLANVYESGTLCPADEEKADVWYRGAARAAAIDLDPASRDYVRAMAALGSGRHCEHLREGDAGRADIEAWRARARARGYSRCTGLEPRGASGGFRFWLWVVGASLRASARSFVYASVFVAAAAGAGLLLAGAVRALLLHGAHLPLLVGTPERVLTEVLATLGIVPAFLVYRATSVARAAIAAIGAGLMGHAVWATPRGVIVHERLAQTLVFSTVAFLAALLVLGVLGGAKGIRKTVR
jgi:hypothetical protein